VYVGADKPLLREWQGPVPWIHGTNGLGDADLPPMRTLAQDEPAASFIRRTILEHPGEVTLIPVARMTNVASVIQFDPSIVEKIQRIVMMGGAAFCPGNVTPVAEANIWGDPEAAHIVFHSGAPITMVGLDVTMQARLTTRHLETLRESPYAAFLKQAVSFYIGAYERTQAQEEGDRWCALHDPLAVAMVEDPTLCETREYYVDVETEGRLTAGMTVVDARKTPDHRPNASVCVGIDVDRFLKWCADRIGFAL
jgi:purine nucleosidase